MTFQKPGRQALQWLERAGASQAGGLLRQAHELARLQEDIDSWSAGNRLRLYAGPFRQGSLRLFSDHPAMLARARQQLPTLRAYLNARGWHIETVDLKVRSGALQAVQPPREKRGRFSEKAGEEWVELLDKLQDERLKAVTRKLCERNGWQAGE